jgi:hypothetical protein
MTGGAVAEVEKAEAAGNWALDDIIFIDSAAFAELNKEADARVPYERFY